MERRSKNSSVSAESWKLLAELFCAVGVVIRVDHRSFGFPPICGFLYADSECAQEADSRIITPGA
jgi:hypothetical protein